MKSHFVLLCVFAGCLLGCETAPHQTQPLAAEKILNAPKSSVWRVVVAEVGIEYPVKSSDPTTGLISTDVVLLPVGNWNVGRTMQRWVLPPGGNLLMGYSNLRVMLNIRVAGVGPGRTQIAIRPHYEALQGPIGSPEGTWVAVRSNGSLEGDILRRIEGKMIQ